MKVGELLSFNPGSFVKGAAILAAAGIASRVIGAFFRIVLAAILGDEGIGLYQYAYPIYSTLLVISTAGIPVALSKIMAEKIAMQDYGEAVRVFRIAFIILSLSGLVIATGLAMGARYTAVVLIGDAKAYYPIIATAPAIFFVTLMASFRGYFQGSQNMAPTAASQLVEQLVRVGFAVGMVILLMPVGLEYAAAGATSGAAAGGLAGLVLLTLLYFVKRKDLYKRAVGQDSGKGESFGRIAGRLFSLAVPVTIGGLVIPLITVIDLAVVPRQLQAAGFDLVTARALYGQLTGMAASVVYFPNVVALALSISLVPAISEAAAIKDRDMIIKRSNAAIKLTAFFAIPAAIGLFILAEPITILLFNNAEAGFALAYLSWSAIPLCLYVTTTGLIQGLGRPIIPALNMFYGGAVKTVAAWYLTAMPELNVGGAAIASVAGIGVAAALNLYHVARLTGWRFSFKELALLPGAAASIMGGFVWLVYRLITLYFAAYFSSGTLNGLAVILSIGAGFFLYGLILLIFGSIRQDELKFIPLIGGRLKGLLRKNRRRG